MFEIPLKGTYLERMDSYQKVDALNNSFLKGLQRDVVKTVKKKLANEKESSTFFDIGNIAEIMVQSPTSFMSHFYVMEKKPGTEAFIEAADIVMQNPDYKELLIQGAEQLPSDPEKEEAILELVVNLCAQVEYKGAKKAATLYDHMHSKGFFSYLKALIRAEGKIVVGLDQVQDAQTALSSFSGSLSEKMMFMNEFEEENVTVLHQVPVYTELLGQPVKILIDTVVIDHANKTVWLFDLKTTMATSETFDYECVKYGYDKQASFYTKVFLTAFGDAMEEADYSFSGFYVVPLSKDPYSAKSVPVLISTKHINMHWHGYVKNGIRYPGYEEVIGNYIFKKSSQPDLSMWNTGFGPEIPHLLQVSSDIVVDGPPSLQ